MPTILGKIVVVFKLPDPLIGTKLWLSWILLSGDVYVMPQRVVLRLSPPLQLLSLILNKVSYIVPCSGETRKLPLLGGVPVAN